MLYIYIYIYIHNYHIYIYICTHTHTYYIYKITNFDNGTIDLCYIKRNTQTKLMYTSPMLLTHKPLTACLLKQTMVCFVDQVGPRSCAGWHLCLRTRCAELGGGWSTANLPTNIVGFRGLDSSIILI